MSIDWDQLEPKARSENVPLDGPVSVFGGRGVRINAKTVSAPDNRAANLHERMHAVALRLCNAEDEAVSRIPLDGYTKIHGGAIPLYVRGSTELEVLTTLGRSMVSASPEDRAYFETLGLVAMREWS